DRVTERERLFIEQRAPGKWNEISEVLVQRYPGDWYAHNGLGISWRLRGEVEKALVEFREALRLNPDHAFPYANLGMTLLLLNRIEEAQRILDQGLARHLETSSVHLSRYRLAFIRGDDAAMKQQVDWARGRPDEDELVSRQARTAAFAGHLRQAQEFSSRAIELAQRGQKMTRAATFASQSAIWNALSGDCLRARTNASRARALSRSSSLQSAARALAVCGELVEAEALAGESAKSSQSASAQEIRALVAIRRGKPDQALESLSSDRTMFSAYARGPGSPGRTGRQGGGDRVPVHPGSPWPGGNRCAVPPRPSGHGARRSAHGRDPEEPHQLSDLPRHLEGRRPRRPTPETG
ncbi:MAG: tetratricopeptide repeat protein, partial [Spirochaetes bacterium]|nr:tetratricopeptide repeat protein [Spirochaetota bacterium]